MAPKNLWIQSIDLEMSFTFTAGALGWAITNVSLQDGYSSTGGVWYRVLAEVTANFFAMATGTSPLNVGKQSIFATNETPGHFVPKNQTLYLNTYATGADPAVQGQGWIRYVGAE